MFPTLLSLVVQFVIGNTAEVQLIKTKDCLLEEVVKTRQFIVVLLQPEFRSSSCGSAAGIGTICSVC